MKTSKSKNEIGEGLDLKDLLDCYVIRKNGKVYVSCVKFENFLIPFKGIYNTEVSFCGDVSDALAIKSESLAKTLFEMIAKNYDKAKFELLILREVLK